MQKNVKRKCGEGKKGLVQWICLLMLAGMLTGCGGNTQYETDTESGDDMAQSVGEDASQDAKEDTAQGNEEAAAEDNDEGTGELISDEEAASMRSVEKFMIEDYVGETGVQFPVYGPKGSDYEYGSLMYYDHGIMYSATAYEEGSSLFMYELFDMMVDSQEEDWESDTRYSDIQVGELQSSGDDRHLFLSARGEDFYGTPYDKKMVYYLDMQENDNGVIWTIEIDEPDLDEDSGLLLDEMARCYGIDLSSLDTDGEWAQNDQQRQVDEQDVYTPEEGELVLDKVDGYQYLGVATLSIGENGRECPAMGLMGRSTTVKEGSILSSMHGVMVSVYGQKMLAKNFLDDVRITFDAAVSGFGKFDYYKNEKMSDITLMEGYDEAAYFVQDYDRYRSTGEYACHETRVSCYIRIDEDYLLSCDIVLDDSEFDAATGAVIGELEKAYGIDLSEYYAE